MDAFLRDRTEDYLAGRLPAAEQERFERLLTEDAEADGMVAGFRETASLFEAIKVPADEIPALDPAFYARLRQTIDAENAIPFWAALVEPFMIKRLAFGALMWLFALGSLTLMTEPAPEHNRELVNMILKDQPPAGYYVRMGPDLDQNRDSMLAVMMAQPRVR